MASTTHNIHVAGSAELAIDPTQLSDLPTLAFDDSETFDNTFNLDMFNDDPIFRDDQDNTWNFVTSPPNLGLYSTPGSWEIPQQQHQVYQPSQPVATFRPTMTALSAAQREKLRNIAMPKPTQLGQHQSPESSNTQTSESGSPDHENTRKRKSSAEADEEDEDDNGQHRTVKKTAHNMIEKRYRTNLNDKFTELRDCVPSLLVMAKAAKGEDTSADREDLQGLTPAHKHNKATILSKATEYIRHMKKTNKKLQEDNAHMKQRINAFEKLFHSGSMSLHPIQTPTDFSYQPEFYTTPNSQTATRMSPQGMIDVPDDIRRMNAQVMQHNQQVYQGQERYIPTSQSSSPSGGWAGNGYFGKMMVGSLAALMILEGFTENEPGPDEPASRGLFALPVSVLRGLNRSLRTSDSFLPIGYGNSTETYTGLKVMLVVGAIVYILLPLFIPKPAFVVSAGKSSRALDRNSSENNPAGTPPLLAAPSLASSIHVRRLAWLTSIQTVWVPRHNFFLEAIALLIKAAKLSLRNALGWYGYATLTGTTQEQEAARVKAWSIALDAQLGGGDVEISKSRLILTLLASGTLPDTPARLMMKALHIRVLLWEFGNAGANGFFLFHEIAAKLARWKWNEARQLQLQLLTSQSSADAVDVEPLAPHLKVLLEQECDDVLVESIGQRAHNLAWNQDTTKHATGPMDGMDDVVSDFAIRSPLDAVAAWFSSLRLQSALSTSLKTSSPQDNDSIEQQLDLALATAPIGSSAQARALVARTFLLEKKRGANISAALQILRPRSGAGTSLCEANDNSFFVPQEPSLGGLPELKVALKCATALAHLQRTAISSSAYAFINSIHASKLGLLGFVAAYKLMLAIDTSPDARLQCSSLLEGLAGRLRVWIGGKDGLKMDLDMETMGNVGERCSQVSRRCVGLQEDVVGCGVRDDGYESMSAQDDADDGC